VVAVSLVAASQLGDGFGHTFFGADDQLINEFSWLASSCASARVVMEGCNRPLGPPQIDA
jgi:hypothetical protein